MIIGVNNNIIGTINVNKTSISIKQTYLIKNLLFYVFENYIMLNFKISGLLYV